MKNYSLSVMTKIPLSSECEKSHQIALKVIGVLNRWICSTVKKSSQPIMPCPFGVVGFFVGW